MIDIHMSWWQLSGLWILTTIVGRLAWDTCRWLYRKVRTRRAEKI